VIRATPMATLAVSRSVPEGTALALAASPAARRSSSTTGPTRARYSAPASVSDRVRVVRWNSRSPSCPSRAAIARETEDGSRSRSRATAAKPP
jgi:hypothetical protein